jgi:hypothetical protein
MYEVQVSQIGLMMGHTLNVRSPSESNWPDDGSIRTETCCLLYFNKIYVSVMFRRNILLIIQKKKT